MQQKLTVDKWMQGYHGDGHHAHIPSSSSCEKNMGKIRVVIQLLTINLHVKNCMHVAETGFLLDQSIYQTNAGSVAMSTLVKSHCLILQSS